MKQKIVHIGLGFLFAALGVFSHTAVMAQVSGQQPAALDSVGIDPHLGDRIPLNLVFENEKGREVALSSYFDGDKPVLLNFVYHNCPMLCSLVLDHLTSTMHDMSWVPGNQFTVLTISFNPEEKPDLATRQKERYLLQLEKPEAAPGWHFLTGSNDNIQKLAGATGFKFQWVEEQKTYAHPASLIFLSGDGTITRYLTGIDYPAKDVRKALVEASNGTVGTFVDKIILYCFQYDATANAYVLQAINIMKLGGVLTIILLGGLLLFFWRKERQKHSRLAAIT